MSKAQTPEQRLEGMKLLLPKVVASSGSYVGAVRIGSLIYLSGKGPKKNDGDYLTGKLGLNLNAAEGAAAAKLVGLAQLSELKRMLGDLSKVKRIVKVNGYVNSSADFTEQSLVIDGYSNLMISVFGENGKHVRTSVGVSSLPLNMAVEIEMVVEVWP